MNEITKAKLIEYMGHLPASDIKPRVDGQLIYALTRVGYSPKEIAERMKISRNTVTYWRRKIASKHYKETK